jgi:hypothetical protein
MSFAERFVNYGLSFDCTQKRMADLESAQKIGLDTILKICKISKMFFMGFIQINT